MGFFNQLPGVKFVLLSFLAAVFLLVGCAGQNREIARQDLIKADSMIEAAKIAGIYSMAPLEMLPVHQDLQQAKALFNQDPQTGKLTGNISGKSELNRLSSEKSRRAMAGVRQALQNLQEQAGEVSPEEISELRAGIEQEAEEKLVALSKELEADYNQMRRDNQQHLDTVAAELRDYRNEARLAAAKLENIRQSLGAGGQAGLSAALANEFADDLAGWGAEIDRETLSIRFVGPATAFKNASTWVNRPLRRILKDFFPRLVKVVTRPEFKSRIEEIRVEGYASSVHKRAKNDSERHRLNLEFSQERAANVVNILLQQPTLPGPWLRGHLVAAGMSDKRPVYTADGLENHRQSRRIEVRIVMADIS